MKYMKMDVLVLLQLHGNRILNLTVSDKIIHLLQQAWKWLLQKGHPWYKAISANVVNVNRHPWACYSIRLFLSSQRQYKDILCSTFLQLQNMWFLLH